MSVKLSTIGDRPIRIFSFWTNGAAPETPPPPATIAAWQARYPDYRVFSDEDVFPLLAAHGEAAAALYRDIRIPACRADLARLLLLEAHGGLYVDMHCAPGSAAALARIAAELGERELILFDESALRTDADRHCWLLNSAIAAQPGCAALGRMAATALGNLAAHRHAEAASRPAHLPYSIYRLSGPWVIWHEVFTRADGTVRLKDACRGRVGICAMDDGGEDKPVLLYRFNGYRAKDTHWSRREKREVLFRSNEAAAAVSPAA